MSVLEDAFERYAQDPRNQGLDQQISIERAAARTYKEFWDAGVEDIETLSKTKTPKFNLPIYHPSPDHNLGTILAEIRQIRGFSRRNLALTAGTAIRTVELIEKGLNNPSVQIVRKLAAGLRIPVGFLFGEGYSPARSVLESLEKDLANPINQEAVNQHILKQLIKDVRLGRVHLSLLDPNIEPKTNP